jgi:nitroimidazol reductase NimA-like FMN-containing flavoprotein (pyridoxamine 5'-phosphate oxidase superfamily)
MTATYPPTPRTTPNRRRNRASYDRDVVHAILDEAYVCHLSFVADGEPRILPTLHVRIDETLYVHGSTGSRPMLAGRGEAVPICVAVTLIDGLVLARSQFHHSANYRSVVAHGPASVVIDEAEKAQVFAALVEKVSPGRSALSRPPTPREMAETAVLALPLREVSAKIRTGGVVDDEADLTLPYWAGVVPLRLTPGPPQPEPDVTAPLPPLPHSPHPPR